METAKNMPHDLVKTKDKLNNVPGIAKLTEFEQDLFRCLIWRLQYQLDPVNDTKSKPCNWPDLIEKLTIRLTREDLLKIIPKSKYYKNERQLYLLVLKATDDIFKIDFRYIYDDGDARRHRKKFNMFASLDTVSTKPLDDPENPADAQLDYVEFTLNPLCCWLIENLSEKYTSIYIDNFTSIKGRYAKALYVLLRDWRTKGFWHIAYERFRFLMSVPKSYTWSDVLRRVLTPAINELKSIMIDPNGNTSERPLFTNLYYRTNTKPCRGRCGFKVESIDFIFTPEQKNGRLIDAAPLAQKSARQKKIPTAAAAAAAAPVSPDPASPAPGQEPGPVAANRDNRAWSEDEIDSLLQDGY